MVMEAGNSPGITDVAVQELRPLVVLCSHGIADPLVATLMLDYLLKLQDADGDRPVLLFTEEAHRPADADHLREKLMARNITWQPLHYDPGAPRQWWRKLGNGIRMFSSCRRFLRRYPGAAVLGFLAMAGAYAVLLRRLLPFGKGITFCFEPHSRYMREMGVWSPGGAKYRVMRALERMQLRRMDELTVPTNAGLEDARAAGRMTPTHLLGITIDVRHHAYDAAARTELRARYDFGNDPVLVYVGKFGDIYHGLDDYLAFLEGAFSVVPGCRAMVITHTRWVEALEGHPQRAALGDRLVVLPPVPAEGLHRHLSAADFGVVAIPPTPAQAYRTPVKTVHYWAAGLPVIIPRGVGDDHEIAKEDDTGIVVADLPGCGTDAFAGAVARYRAMDADALRERCMACALRHRDSSHTVALLSRLLS